MTRSFIAVLVCLLFVALGNLAWAAERPNIVLFLLDDVGYSDYGCYGSEIATPNIDRLAREGLQFTHFYNNAVCVPTRASLYSGLYPRYVNDIRLTDNMPTLAEVLRAAGYRTSLSGKWHLGRVAPNHPLDRGFENYYGLLDGCSNHFDPSIPDPAFEGGRVRHWADGRERVFKFPENFYSTDAITDHAIENVKQFHRSGKPFFVNICYTAAHSPMHAKPADIAKYRGRYSAGWDALRRARHQRQLQLGFIDPGWKLPIGEPEFPAWNDEPLKEWNENLMAVYAAMVDSVDQNIGRMLKTLEELKADQNTIVLVLNDNGGCAEQAGGDDPTNIAGPKDHYVSCGAGWAHAQNTPLRRYKAWCHEGGISTPLVVRWPGVAPAGKVVHQVGHVIDLLPTFSELAGATQPETRLGAATIPWEGQSLVNVFRQPDVNQPRKLYWAANDNRALRDGRWKIAWDQNIRQWELYDIVADRSETNNLAAINSDRTRAMIDDWQAWADRTGATKRLGVKFQLKDRAKKSP